MSTNENPEHDRETEFLVTIQFHSCIKMGTINNAQNNPYAGNAYLYG